MTNKIYKLCKDVQKIKPCEIAELRATAQRQVEFEHPLKMATATKQHSLGEYNHRVLDAVENFIRVIKEGPEQCQMMNGKS